MTYLQHLRINLRVAKRSAWFAMMHFLHGLIPCRWTDHHTYESPPADAPTPAPQPKVTL